MLVEHLATRLRRFGSRHWREVLSAGVTAADTVHELVGVCALRDAEIGGDRRPGAPAVPNRPAYDAALADQLAVVGRDLALALDRRDDPALAAQVLAELSAYASTLRVTPPPP